LKTGALSFYDNLPENKPRKYQFYQIVIKSRKSLSQIDFTGIFDCRTFAAKLKNKDEKFFFTYSVCVARGSTVFRRRCDASDG
jgi:hypothetical protein